VRILHPPLGSFQESSSKLQGQAIPQASPIPRNPISTTCLWTIATERLILQVRGPDMNNLQRRQILFARRLSKLIYAGLNDWGGISPVTPDTETPRITGAWHCVLNPQER